MRPPGGSPGGGGGGTKRKVLGLAGAFVLTVACLVSAIVCIGTTRLPSKPRAIAIVNFFDRTILFIISLYHRNFISTFFFLYHFEIAKKDTSITFNQNAKHRYIRLKIYWNQL
jgi:hypothetical protein